METLCADHGPALLGVARLLLDDAGEARQAVTDVLVQAGREGTPVGTGEPRRHLARELYRRCTRTQLESRTRGAPGAVLTRLSTQQRAALALCVHGDHTYADAADVLSLPRPVVAELLRTGLLRVAGGTVQRRDRG